MIFWATSWTVARSRLATALLKAFISAFSAMSVPARDGSSAILRSRWTASSPPVSVEMITSESSSVLALATMLRISVSVAAGKALRESLAPASAMPL